MSRIPQACDPCKRRKVRCNGQLVCQQCTHLGLTCQYSKIDPTARTRRSIVRGAIINEHRKPPLATFARVVPQLSTAQVKALSTEVPTTDSDVLFNNAYFASLLDDYSNFVFPFLPVIPTSRFRSLVAQPTLGSEDNALVHALAAVTTNMTKVRPRGIDTEHDQVQKLYTKALELRGAVLPDCPITIENTMISLLVSICIFARRSNTKMGFYFLREAITRLQILEESKEILHGKPDKETMAQLERLHWLLFVHERFVSIVYTRTILLEALPTCLVHEPTMEDLVTEGFNHIIALFSVVDTTFIEHWLDRQSPSLIVAWLDRKQVEIGLDMDACESDIKNLAEMQQVDIIVTRYWLHMVLWQMALSKLLLNSSIEEDFRSIMFPIRLSRRLRCILAVMQLEAVQVHGTGIVQKIFDITNTIADIIIHVPLASIGWESPEHNLDDFLFLHRFLLRMSEFHPVEEAVLDEKLQQIRTKAIYA